MNKVLIFDTTLRDGEQSPGFSMNVEEKLRMAHQLERLSVDVIEAGFPIASEGEFEAVRTIANELKTVKVAAFARANETDIIKAAEALQDALLPRIHVVIATSDIHLEKKLKMTKEQVLERAMKGVMLARRYVDDVEFCAEDASRSSWEFLNEIFSAVISVGATTINVPDTVGYSMPEEFSRLIKYLKNHVKGIEKTVIGVHCHNDLGLAVANSLAALKAGARQIECTINGIGERAGNASLEEVVMNLLIRKDLYLFTTTIDTRQLYPTSRLLTEITGIGVQPNKAIVGANALAHEAGIHQDGVLKDCRTYEIFTPETIGLPSNSLILGKHSGRHAFKERLKALGYELSEDEFHRAFNAFKVLTDKQKVVDDEDLKALISQENLSFRNSDKEA